MGSNLQGQVDECISNIYSMYLGSIQILLIDVEMLTGQFPVQILNEIRSIFTHLARADAYRNKDLQLAHEECTKAERHVQRAILDCYKILCMAYFGNYMIFKDAHKHIDLHLADNGAFAMRLQALENEAKDAYKAARRADCDRDCRSDAEIYELFETAYHAHVELSVFLDESAEKIRFCESKTGRGVKIGIVGSIIGIAGTLWGVIRDVFRI